MDTLSQAPERNAEERKVEIESELPPQPYPGLNYYRNDESNARHIFAGRGPDVKRCLDSLKHAHVLVLHGRTGCGKSSFLRVGLAPDIDADLQTEDSEDAPGKRELVIWRTGPRPIKTIANAFLAFYHETVKSSVKDAAPSGGRRERVKLKDVLQGLDEDAFIAKAADDPHFLLTCMRNFELARSNKRPLFVLDQAEEMWTLSRRRPGGDLEAKNDKRQPEKGAKIAKSDASVPAEEILSAGDAKRERRKLFEFISQMDNLSNISLLVSMRTEYKGQFDDELVEISTEAPRLVRGYYLDELGEDALIKAIERPTGKHDDEDTGAALQRKYKFKYEPGLAAHIAKSLLDEKKGVPRGGVLPVLQVTCLRLWETTRRRESVTANDPSWTIKRSDFDQLGDINRQIELFVQERLEAALEGGELAEGERPMSGEDKKKEVLDEAEKWYRMLNEALVNIESDGRVTTRKASPRELRQKGLRMGLSAFANASEDDASAFYKGTNPGKILAYLSEQNILREDDVREKGKEKEWSLGHDSVGLTLNRWSQVYGYQFDTMSKMEMMATTAPDKFKEAALFDKAPTHYRLETINDSVWDHQILHYAKHKGFAQRLGIIIDSAGRDTVGTAKNRANVSLDAAIKEMNRVEPSEDKARFLISWPRSEFPKEGRAKNWTDLVITNAYQGYGLLCPPSLAQGKDFRAFEDLRRQMGRGSDTDKEAEVKADRSALTEFRNSMKLVVEFIKQRRSEKKPCKIWLFDNSAEVFLNLILDLANLDPDDVALVKDVASKDYASKDYGAAADELARDPIFARLLSDGGRDDFMIGTAFGRALATRTGYRSLVDVQDVHTLIRWVSSADGGANLSTREREEFERRKRDWMKRLQQTQTHTTWQISLPHEQLDDGRMEQLVYRVAALGFYTVEYIRTNADDFVRFIDEHLQTTARRGTFKLDREFIRKAVRSCYAFFPFEQYASQYLDRASPVAYWQESGNELSRLRDVYSRMLEFRDDFFREFQQFNAQYIRLTRELGEEKLYEDRRYKANVETVNHLSLLAWNNFKILNFYDALAFIKKARDKLQDLSPHPMTPD